MASKTALPIAQLRALGCSIGTIPGHWPTAPFSPSWQYSITLPKGVDNPLPTTRNTLRGVASASVARDGRIIVRAFAPGDGRISKAHREDIERDVVALFSAIIDLLEGK